MIKKIVGTILLIAGVALAVVLYSKGMFIFPHITGPSVLAAIGVYLIAAKSKADKPAK